MLDRCIEWLAIPFLFLLIISYIGLIAAGIYGWVMNIVQLASMADSGFTLLFALKLIGVLQHLLVQF